MTDANVSCICIGLLFLTGGATMNILCKDAGQLEIVNNETVVNMDCGGNDKFIEISKILLIVGYVLVGVNLFILCSCCCMVLCVGICCEKCKNDDDDWEPTWRIV